MRRNATRNAPQKPENENEANIDPLVSDGTPHCMKSEYGSSSAVRFPISIMNCSRNDTNSDCHQQSERQSRDISLEDLAPRRDKYPPRTTLSSNATNNKMSVHNLISDDASDEQGFNSNPVISNETPDTSYQEDGIFGNKPNAFQMFRPGSRQGLGNTVYPSLLSSPISNHLRFESGPPMFPSAHEGSRRKSAERQMPRFSSRYVEKGSMQRERDGVQGFTEEKSLPVDYSGIPSSAIDSGKKQITTHEGAFPNSQRTVKSPYQPLVNEPKAKRPWTEQEDSFLRSLVDQLGQGLWAAIASQIPGRSGKQVRERWLNHLSPNVTKRPWSSEEDDIIIESHRRFGNCWSRIAKLLEGRSDNSVKNRFYTTLRRRISTPSIPRTSGKRGNQTFAQENLSSKRRRTSPTPQQPSEQVEIVNRRYKQARVWE